MPKNLVWIVSVGILLAAALASASGSWSRSTFPTSLSPDAISTDQVSSNIGNSVKVEGVVSEVYASRGGTVFVDLDGAYPNEPFTAVIFADDVSSVGDLSAFDGKRVDVSGTIQLYRGRPEIVVSSREQIALAP